MHQVHEIKDYLSKLMKGEFPHRAGVTHLFELLVLMKTGLEGYSTTTETHYLNDGIMSEIKFADGKTYRIEIREVVR